MNQNHIRLLAIHDLYWNIPNMQKASPDRDRKIFLAKVRAGIDFVADKMFHSVARRKWNLSEKQLVCLEKAEAVIMEAGL